jgi:hypothetical protein
MTDITIPPEALRAARVASMNARGDGEDPVRAACIAMLKAWPGMRREIMDRHFSWSRTSPIEVVEVPYIILPLPRQNSND